MHLSVFSSVSCRTIVIPWLLLGFLLGFEEFIKRNEGNKPPFGRVEKINPKGLLKRNADFM